jgi:hypothetical protein
VSRVIIEAKVFVPDLEEIDYASVLPETMEVFRGLVDPETGKGLGSPSSIFRSSSRRWWILRYDGLFRSEETVLILSYDEVKAGAPGWKTFVA